MTQEEWGNIVLGGVSRFVVNRIEVGTSDLKLEQARLVDEFIGKATLVPLVEHRLRVASGSTGEDGRDVLVQRLLGMDGIRRTRMVLCDDLDAAGLLHAAALGGQVDVVVPSPRRSRELFGDALFDQHVERQVAYLMDIHDLHRNSGRETQIHVYESDAVLFSMIHVDFAGGQEAAYWPPVPRYPGAAAELPVVTTSEPAICERLARYADEWITQENRVQPNEAVVIPFEDESGCKAQFTRFVPRGSDPPFEPGEGHPVALVMPYAMTVRRGRPVGLRVILHERIARRDSVGKISLLSKRVTEEEIREVLSPGSDRDGGSRRRRDPLASAIEVGRELMEHDLDYISSDMYRKAAEVDLKSNWGIVLPRESFKEVALPPELATIHKGNQPHIVPKLFVVELQSQPDSVLGEAPITRLMQGTARHGSVQLGYEDVMEIASSKLNSFLERAREIGFLEHLMIEQIGISPR